MAPFKSKAQQKFMFANKPKIAKKWAAKYGVPKGLPEKKKDLPGMSVHPVVNCNEHSRRRSQSGAGLVSDKKNVKSPF